MESPQFWFECVEVGEGILHPFDQWYTAAMPSIESEAEDIALKLGHMASEFAEGV